MLRRVGIAAMTCASTKDWRVFSSQFTHLPNLESASSVGVGEGNTHVSTETSVGDMVGSTRLRPGRLGCQEQVE